MIQVKNRACVRTIAVRSLRASKMRNLIAVIAIMLTTMLFTALFTIAISINDSFQQSNFLMVGGDAHGAFKKLTEEQMETLKKDPLIQETGARLFLGMGTGDAFRKTHVEVSYMDAHGGKHYFCTPTHGHRPKEGSNEAMTDTRVLKLLGVQPKIGTKFTVTYQIGGVQSEPKTVTQEFVLSGWWDYNGVSQASHVIVPKSYVKKTLQHVEIGEEEECGTWTLDVMFGNALHIEKDMRQVIRDCGFQSEDASKTGLYCIWCKLGLYRCAVEQQSESGKHCSHCGIACAHCIYRIPGHLQCVSDFRCQRYPFLRTVKNDRHDRAAAQADHPAAGSPFIRHWNPGGTSSGIWNRRGTGTGCHGTDELHDSGYKIACVGICGSSTFFTGHRIFILQ